MTAKSSFLPRLSLSRHDNSPVLPLHNSRYPNLRAQRSDYDLDQLSPRDDDGLRSPSFRDPNSLPTSAPSSNNANTKSSNRKPTGAMNRRPSNSSSAGSASKFRAQSERILFTGPPPPIAVSRILYRDEEQRHMYEDNESEAGAASWLPGTARRALSSVIWDRSDNGFQDSTGEKPVAFDRNSIWRGLARREKAIVAEVQRYLQIQEDSLNGGQTHEQDHDDGGRYSDAATTSDGGSATPTGHKSMSSASSRNPHRSVSFLEPVTAAGPGGEIIPVRQPRQKKLGISGARKGIARSMVQLGNLKAEEDASLLAAISTRKQALAKLRQLATKRDGISEELTMLETDEEEPLTMELHELESEHRDVSLEINELEERLAGLKNRKRLLESRMGDVRNRREAGLSGYKNALKEVEDSVKNFLARPPVKPLDVEALRDSTKWEEQPESPGGVEFMHMRPERRTVDMAREWWDAEVSMLERRKAEVDTERAALEEGGAIWDEVNDLVLTFERELRRQMTDANEADATGSKGKGKDRELSASQALKLQYEKINTVIMGLDQRLRIAEEKGWNLLIAAIGAELEAFREAARINRDMLQAAGIAVDEDLLAAQRVGEIYREDSGTTASQNSFHTVNGGSMNLAEQLLDLPNNHEDDDRGAESSDNEVPQDFLATHEIHGHDEHHQDDVVNESLSSSVARGPMFEREDNENEVPAEFLVEHHDTRL